MTRFSFQMQSDNFRGFQSDPEVVRFLQQLLQHDVHPTNLKKMVDGVDKPQKKAKTEAPTEEKCVKIEGEASAAAKFSYLAKKTSAPVVETNTLPHKSDFEYARVASVDPFWEAKRMEMIKLQQETMEVKQAPLQGQVCLPPLKMGANISQWTGNSVYGNFPEAAKPELDRLLKTGHHQKVCDFYSDLHEKMIT